MAGAVSVPAAFLATLFLGFMGYARFYVSRSMFNGFAI